MAATGEIRWPPVGGNRWPLTPHRAGAEHDPLDIARRWPAGLSPLREVRPLFVKTRTHQRTVYRPGEICQWDLWETSRPVPVGHGQMRRAWVLVCCLGYSRVGAGALIFSRQAPDVPSGMSRCLWSIGALPRPMV